MDPLLRRRDGHHLLCGYVRIWPGSSWRWDDGLWRKLWNEKKCKFRTECTSHWSSLTRSATTNGSRTLPSFSSSTRKIFSRKRSRRVLLPSASQNIQVSFCLIFWAFLIRKQVHSQFSGRQDYHEASAYIQAQFEAKNKSANKVKEKRNKE